jgi:hypothetical protein
MELTPRQLAFLEHEMKQIKNDQSRPSEDRSHASSVLGRIEGEIEHKKDQNRTESPDNTADLFS